MLLREWRVSAAHSNLAKSYICPTCSTLCRGPVFLSLFVHFFFSSSIYFLALVRTLEEPWSLPSVLCRPCTCSVLPCSNKTSLPNYRTFVASYSVRYAFTTMQTFSLERLLSVSRVFEAGWRTNSVTAVRNLAHFFIHSSDIVLVSSGAFVQSLRHLIFTDAVVYSG